MVHSRRHRWSAVDIPVLCLYVAAKARREAANREDIASINTELNDNWRDIEDDATQDQEILDQWPYGLTPVYSKSWTSSNADIRTMTTRRVAEYLGRARNSTLLQRMEDILSAYEKTSRG